MKEQIKKLVAFVTSALMALALVPGIALAAGTGSITITPPTGQSSDVTYTVYKVFDGYGNGTNISYKVMSSKADKALPEGFVTDSAGNVIFGTKDANGVVTPSTATELTANQISSVADYVKGDTAVGTATKQSDGTYKLSNLDDGYYYVTTSTGSLVVINTANHNASVNDKNTVPSVTKVISSVDGGNGSVDADGKNALAEVGSTVHYTATVTFGKGSKSVVFHDKMFDGLDLNVDSIKVTGLPEGATSTTQTTATDGDTFDISFSDGIPEGTKAVITYTATVTSDSFSSSPATNTAKVTYGDPSNSTSEVTVNVYNATVTVNKTFTGGTINSGDSAQFVLKNAEGKYYLKSSNDVSWVDTEDAATKLTFSQAGSQFFTGLGNGTYTLIESKAPAGFSKAADQTVTINDANSTTAENRAQSKDIENKAGTALPTTGGMGTTLFTVVGAALVVAAGVLLVTRRRMQQ